MMSHAKSIIKFDSITEEEQFTTPEEAEHFLKIRVFQSFQYCLNGLTLESSLEKITQRLKENDITISIIESKD